MFPANIPCSLLVTCFSLVFAAKTQLGACCATGWTRPAARPANREGSLRGMWAECEFAGTWPTRLTKGKMQAPKKKSRWRPENPRAATDVYEKQGDRA